MLGVFRTRRPELRSKLFSLIGGMVMGLSATILAVIPASSPRPVAVAAAFDLGIPHSGHNPKEIERHPPAPTDGIAPFADTAPRNPEQPVMVTAAPITPLQISTPLPDQTARNLELQHQIIQSETIRSTNRLTQDWQPIAVHTPRYQPHNQSGNGRPHPTPDQPEVTGRGTRRPRPPEGPEPAVLGGDLR